MNMEPEMGTDTPESEPVIIVDNGQCQISLSSKMNVAESLATDDDLNETENPFDISTNCTVIERCLEEGTAKSVCEGSDSGVEIIENNDGCPSYEQRPLRSRNIHDFDNIRSCDSSISYCSNYDEAYNLLVRRNSTLFDNCTLRNGDRTSDNGSESSSVTGASASSKNTKIVKRKTSSRVEIKDKTRPSSILPRNQANTIGNSSPTVRLKSLDRLQKSTPSPTGVRPNCLRSSKQVPNNPQTTKREPVRRSLSVRTPSTNRSPTDDGRWPSVHSRPAPLLSKTAKGSSVDTATSTKQSTADTKIIEKYATLPRRTTEKTAGENDKNKNSAKSSGARKNLSKENSITPYKLMTIKKRKIRIYQESSAQTALTMEDIDQALQGRMVRPASPEDKEHKEQEVQVDVGAIEVETLKEQNKSLTEKYNALLAEFKAQTQQLREVDKKCRAETLEKESLQQELKRNMERILTILGENSSNEESSSDSLMVLETRFQNVSQVVLEQENEISRVNKLCRMLQIKLEQVMLERDTLAQQQREFEVETKEMCEFIQTEKSILADALRDAETEIKRLKIIVEEKEKGISEKEDECLHLVQLGERKRQENLALQAKLGAMESKCRELLLQQGSSVSGAAIALSAVHNRLDSLTNELISSFSISEQDLEDVIFHNEAYHNSSADTTPERGRKFFVDISPSSKKGSSFVAAVINAIRNNAPFSRDISRGNLHTETSSSNEMLDSETEPYLMMEHVLEDVMIPDCHSHNMISSTHSLMNCRLSHSESLKDLSHSILYREKSEQSHSLSASFSTEVYSNEMFPMTLIDQVIDVDNSITKLLKVIRIIQVDSEDCMNELEDQKECLSEQIEKQKETNKFVVKQLKDWEFLGAKLKGETKDLKEKLAEKDSEMEKLKIELNKQREQLEKQNQDVCELSTALSKIEFEAKSKEEEVNTALKLWEETGQIPSTDVIGKLMLLEKQHPKIKDFFENEQNIDEIKKVLLSRQLLVDKVKEAVAEAKKQYEALDNALEVLHSVQAVVQQCPPLAKLQRDLEEVSFQSASEMPLAPLPDLNANAALLQAIQILETSSPINTTA